MIDIWQINFGGKFKFRSYLSYYNCTLDATSKMIWLHCTGRNIFDVRKFQWLSQELNKLRESLRKSSLPFWSRKSVKTCLNWNSFMLLGSSSLALAASRLCCYKILSTFCFPRNSKKSGHKYVNNFITFYRNKFKNRPCFLVNKIRYTYSIKGLDWKNVR